MLWMVVGRAFGKCEMEFSCFLPSDPTNNRYLFLFDLLILCGLHFRPCKPIHSVYLYFPIIPSIYSF